MNSQDARKGGGSDMTWETVKLSAVIKILSGFAFDSNLFNESEGMPLVRIRDVGRDYSETYFNGTFDERYIIRNEELLISMDGEFRIAKWNGREALLNQRVCKIESVDNTILDEKYLLHYLPFELKKIEDKTSFVTVKHLSVKQINDIDFPLPPLATQQKIAAILDEADALRRKDKALLAKYDELLQAVFYDMFGDVDENTMGQRLGDVISINPKKSELNIAGDTLVSFVPMACVGEKGEFHPLDDKPMSEVKSGFTYFRNSDVLFAKITPCMENGKGAIARNLTNGIGFGSTEFHVLRPNKYLNAEFLYTYLSRPSFRKLAEKNMTGSAGQKRVSTDFLANLKLNIPDVNCQEKFAHIYTNIQHQKAQIIQQQTHSEQLFQSLMQRAFKGELVG